MIVTPSGQIRIISTRASRWLKELAGRKDRHLPKALVRWAATRPENPFYWKTKTRRLTVTLADWTRKKSNCLILEECRPAIAGLTPGEALIVHWVRHGKSNAEIAAIIGVKESTVKKHLENIFVKFDVENRTAAAFHS